jgi:hypothetical protein
VDTSNYFSNFIQTVTELDLKDNWIGNTGAQYIGQVLEENSVREN